MRFINLILTFSIFATPIFSLAQNRSVDALKEGLPNNWQTKGQGIYTFSKWEFNILTKSDLKKEGSRCSIKVEHSKKTNAMTINLTVDDTSEYIVVDDKWQDSLADKPNYYYEEYTTEYSTESRCLFNKSFVLGTTRGIENSVTYNLKISCPKGFKIQKAISCRF